MTRVRCSLAAIAVIVGLANFLWFTVESSALGGDALSGYVSDGRYYVGAGGRFREVARTEWEWSRAHEISLFVTTAISLAGMGYIVVACFSPTLMGMALGADTDERVREVRASGDQIASQSCRGRAGLAVFWGPHLRVFVFPGGILVQEMFGSTAAILRSEVEGVRVNREFFGARGIQVNHSARDVASPLVLGITPESDVARAIEATTGMHVEEQ